MDELSWRARLAKSNINLLDITPTQVLVEFTYHPRPNVFKWCKTTFPTNNLTEGQLASYLQEQVLALRKELEG